MRAFAPLSCSSPSTVVIWPLLNSKSASPCRIDVPGLRPRRAESGRRIGDVQGRLDGRAAFDVDLAGVGEPAGPVHRQSVGRTDAAVADDDAVAVGAAVGQIAADREARCPRRRRSLLPSSSIVPLPVMLTLPVGADRRAVLQKEIAGDAGQARSARCCCRASPASATRAFAPLSCSPPSTVVIWPLLNSKSASSCRIDVPGLRPRRAEPRRRVGDVQGRLDGGAAFDVDLAGAWRARPSRSPSKCRPNVMPPLPIEMALPLVLLLVRLPPIVRLDAPAAALIVAVQLDRAVAGDAHVAGRADRCAVLQPEIAGDAGQAGQRAVAVGVRGVGDARIRAIELQPAIDRRDLAALELQERVVLQDRRSRSPSPPCRTPPPRWRCPGSTGRWRYPRC